MIRIALLLGLLLASCAPAVSAADAAPDAVAFETSAESSMPPLPSLDAGMDGG